MLFILLGERLGLVFLRQAARIVGVAYEIVLIGIVDSNEGDS